MVLTRHLPGETEVNSKNVRIVDFQAEIQTGHFPNTSPTRNSLRHHAQCIHYYRTFLMTNISLFSAVLLLLKNGEGS
jgi:hypothetical protein